ncbi:MAG: hypothetical protein U0M63_01130 [Alistipes onderdonkii]|jgi:hypothetical protein|nr:hypothetical protein [Alistipes onderdonkii]MEE0848256.1 hypothetical protein [Alistipes onderdonkii]DAG10340.1 MAG TPA: hypothetical protein [Caudoviricetes sp.]
MKSLNILKNLKEFYMMKPFDLAAAKAGAAVCTRDGRDVVPVAVDSLLQGPYVFSGIVGFGDVYPDKRVVETWTEEGLPTSLTVGQCGLSLMMRDDDYAEKLAWGEYGNHIDEATEKVDPVVKENLTADREYWRRVYAGQMMAAAFPVLVSTDWQAKGEYANIPTETLIARQAIDFADALLEELEKK